MIKRIVLGGGCFWCVDAAYRLVRGVVSSTCGYAGGTFARPTYESVCSGITGHAEVVRVEYDTDEISLSDILDVFWAIHDPTQLDRQGNDVGTQYRSALYYEHEADLGEITRSAEAAQKLWDAPIVTEIKKLGLFFEAESFHQNYFTDNPERAYCQIIINPKLSELREKYKHLINA